jgi:hypothetical protein
MLRRRSNFQSLVFNARGTSHAVHAARLIKPARRATELENFIAASRGRIWMQAALDFQHSRCSALLNYDFMAACKPLF